METWIYFLISGALIVLLTQYVQAAFHRGQFLHEKLMDRYSELMAVAVQELERAKALLSEIALYRGENDLPALVNLDQQRHDLRSQLVKLSFQIRLMEADRQLSRQVAKLAESQPFQPSLVPPRYGEGNYNERENMFRKQINDFEVTLSGLTRRVLEKHARKELELYEVQYIERDRS
jgi:hypothetical protein